MPPKELLIGQALDDYAKVAGAWFLNKRCRFVTGVKAKKFDDNTAIINVTLSQDINNPDFLLVIQKHARQVAESEKYKNCGRESKNIVNWGVMHAKNWSTEIKRMQSQQKGLQSNPADR